MCLPCYLAMTAAEIAGNHPLPKHPAWMACHFSPYSTGLSNFPAMLPDGAMIILNDRTPIHRHDPILIATQMAQMAEDFHVSAVLIDFQRPGCDLAAEVAREIVSKLPCPVGITEHYAADLPCAVFLSAPPLHKPLAAYLSDWSSRDIWLELGLNRQVMTLTDKGCHISPPLPSAPAAAGMEDPLLHCQYEIDLLPEQAQFTLFRTAENLKALLREAEALGVLRAVGLYQELNGVIA